MFSVDLLLQVLVEQLLFKEVLPPQRLEELLLCKVAMVLLAAMLLFPEVPEPLQAAELCLCSQDLLLLPLEDP
jgi:hypothetical protein